MSEPTPSSTDTFTRAERVRRLREKAEVYRQWAKKCVSEYEKDVWGQKARHMDNAADRLERGEGPR